MQAKIKGPWSAAELQTFLDDTRFPMRLACVAEDGHPRVVSVWFRHAHEQLFCVSHQDSKLVSLLRANPRVGFEIAPNEPPYHGARGQGMATLVDSGGDQMLEELLERYLGGVKSSLANWLLSRAQEEMLISIEPSRWFTWDYRQRMDDIAKPG